MSQSARAQFEDHEDFRAALQTRSIIPPAQIIDDGDVHRCDVVGNGDNGKGDGSYLLRPDGTGWFQNWQDGLSWETWCADTSRKLTAEELAELRQWAEAARLQRQAEEAARHVDTAQKAERLWSAASPSDRQHPYLVPKGVQPHKLRVHNGDLLAPMYDVGGALWNIQRIKPDGSKRFLKGGKVTGCYFTIGGAPSAVVMISEGFATGASGYEAAGYPIAVAFTDTNLLAVARALREKYPHVLIVILADDDYKTAGNPGLTKAGEAAAAVGGAVAIPDFGPDRPDNATDFNDLAQHAGLEAVKRTIEAVLAAHIAGGTSSHGWPKPDMSVLQMHRRAPPAFPIVVLGSAWARWVANAANAAAAPADYVVTPLLSAASVLIGNARWPSATPGWSEPPHLWIGAVGDSGTGKSPGADPFTRDILPVIEQNMLGDFPDVLEAWRTNCAIAEIFQKEWKKGVGQARKKGGPLPNPPPPAGPEPQAPKLRQNDVTIERVATLLASSAPKGLLVWRDELAGWITGMNAYNEAGRAFWLESFGGRPYRVERQKAPPIDIPYLAVGVYGSVQPDKLATLMRAGDDGLLARILWSWPDSIPFHLGTRAPNTEWAIDAFDRLRLLEMAGNPPCPLKVPLAEQALPLLEEFARSLQKQQHETGGLMRSALGKGRGLALRLSLVLEMLWWSGITGADAPPTEISLEAFAAAATLLDEYFLPMAARVYGDAALPAADRNAATIARWILRERPTVINAREIRRKTRLPGLSEAAAVNEALVGLVEADWLRPIPGRNAANPGRQRADYAVNPQIFEESHDA